MDEPLIKQYQGMAAKGGITADDFEEDVAAAASRLGLGLAVAPQVEEIDISARGLRATDTNFVREDGIIKERVEKQDKARLLWEKKWSDMAQCEKLYREEMAKMGVDPRPYSLRPCPPSFPDQTLRESPPVPSSTSGLIGWRSSRSEMSLEMFGPFYKSPVHTIDPPRQENDLPPKQHFIFLG